MCNSFDNAQQTGTPLKLNSNFTAAQKSNEVANLFHYLNMAMNAANSVAAYATEEKDVEITNDFLRKNDLFTKEEVEFMLSQGRKMYWQYNYPELHVERQSVSVDVEVNGSSTSIDIDVDFDFNLEEYEDEIFRQIAFDSMAELFESIEVQRAQDDRLEAYAESTKESETESSEA